MILPRRLRSILRRQACVLRAGAVLAAALGGTLAAAAPAGPPLTITWLGMPRFVAGREGSWGERFLERELNIELKPQFLEYLSYQRRVPLMMLGGSVPDVYWIDELSNLRRNAHHGLALELPYETLVAHAPSYVRLVNEYAPESWLLSYYRGRNFGLPLIGMDYSLMLPMPFLWRADWLERVGFSSPPETLEEYDRAFMAFRKEDPNRSGKTDTYGLSPDGPNQRGTPAALQKMMMEFFGAYGILPGDWMERDGRVVWGGVQPECKEVLALLRRWYAEGVIYPDYITASMAQQMELLFLNNVTGYLNFPGWFRGFRTDLSTSIAYKMARLQPGARIAPAVPPIGPQGRRGGRVAGGAQSILAFGPQLRDEPEKLARILQLIERLASEEQFFMAARVGERGLHWEWTAEQGLMLLPPYKGDTTRTQRELLASDPDVTASWGYFTPFGRPDLAEKWQAAAERTFNASFRRREWALQGALIRPEIVAGAEDLLGDLVQLQSTYYSEIIQLRRPLEDFEHFVELWYRNGGRVLTENAQQLFEEKKQILARTALPPR